MNSKKRFGCLGENFAKGYVKRKGYKILFSPFRCRIGEIDLIAKDDDTLVFIEVKTRKNLYFGTPLEAVTPRKQRQIVRVAKYFLHHVNRENFQSARFDVIGITQPKGSNEPEIIHVLDAFRDDSGI